MAWHPAYQGELSCEQPVVCKPALELVFLCFNLPVLHIAALVSSLPVGVFGVPTVVSGLIPDHYDYLQKFEVCLLLW